MADPANPPYHPTPTPTPRPASEGYVSPADYLAACCSKWKQDYPDLNQTHTAGEFLTYIEQVANVLTAAET